MTDPRAKQVLLAKDGGLRPEVYRHLSEEACEAIFHALQAMEDRAGLVRDLDPRDPPPKNVGTVDFDLVLQARRHMRGVT